MAVYGVFMAPIGWRWALAVWGYSAAWMLVNDRVKLAAYKLARGRPPVARGQARDARSRRVRRAVSRLPLKST